MISLFFPYLGNSNLVLLKLCCYARFNNTEFNESDMGRIEKLRAKLLVKHLRDQA